MHIDSSNEHTVFVLLDFCIQLVVIICVVLAADNCAMNGGISGQMGMEAEPGVVEVMASPESDEPFTEDMINQVIAMLQSEGQITPETHTIIVHTPGGGPTLRVVSTHLCIMH